MTPCRPSPDGVVKFNYGGFANSQIIKFGFDFLIISR